MVNLARGDEDRYPETRKLYYHGPYLIATDGYRLHIAPMPEADRPAEADPMPDRLTASVMRMVNGLDREGKISIALNAEFVRQAVLPAAEVVILSLSLDPAASVTQGPALEVFSLTPPGADGEGVRSYALIKGLNYGNSRFRNIRPRIEFS